MNIRTLNLKEENTPEITFGKDEEALKMVGGMTDKQIEELNRGGYDPVKVFNAYNRATNSKK